MYFILKLVLCDAKGRGREKVPYVVDKFFDHDAHIIFFPFCFVRSVDLW